MQAKEHELAKFRDRISYHSIETTTAAPTKQKTRWQ